jgi:hypothetical protein
MLALVVVSSIGLTMSTKVCSTIVVSLIHHVAMNHQNHTQTNGLAAGKGGERQSSLDIKMSVRASPTA